MATVQTGIATEFIQFTRASNATVTDSDGKVKWASHNLLTNSESFDAAAWTKTTVTPTANSIAAPNGTTTADTLAASGANGTALQTFTAEAISYTFGVWLKRKTGTGNIQIAADSGTYTTVTITSDWALYTVTQTPAAGSKSAGIRIVTSADEVYAWGAHLYRSDLGGMQPNTSAYPMYNPTTPKNLLGYTEDFSNAAWIKGGFLAFGAGSTVNATIAPNGLPTADLMTPDTTVGLHRVVGPTATVLSGTPFRYTVYVKPNGYTKVAFREMATTGDYAAFSLTGAGSVLDKSASATATISALPDGWYLISTSIAAAATLIRYTIYVLDPSYTSGTVEVNWTPNGTSGVYLWGAQFSDSASLDSYSPVYGAAVTSAAYYGPRRDFDPVTLACKGLLVEEQRANLQLRSEEFDVVGTWGRLAVNTPSANSIVSPSGAVTGDIFTEDSTTAFHGIQSNLTLTAAAHTYSVYVKQAFGSRNVLLREGVTTGAFAAFNVTSGTVVGSGSGGVGTITPVGNGWFRCAMTFTAPAGSNTFQIMLSTGTTFVSYAGDGTSGVAVWGAQVELGSFATSYIPVGSTTAGATRNGDVAQVGTAAFPYSATEGTWVANYQTLFSGTISSTGYVLNLDGSASKRILYIGGGADAVASFDGTTIVGTAADVTGPISKSANAYTSSERAVVSSGSTVSTGVSVASYASASTVNIGSTGSISGGGQLNGHIRQITYLPRRISNTELQTRTA